MKFLVPVAALAMSLGIGAASADQPSDQPLTKLDPAFDQLVAPDTKLEVVREGYGFTEGLVYMPQGRRGGYQRQGTQGP